MIIKCENCGGRLWHGEIEVIAWNPHEESMIYFCSEVCFDDFRKEYGLIEIIRLRKGGDKE